MVPVETTMNQEGAVTLSFLTEFVTLDPQKLQLVKDTGAVSIRIVPN